MKIEYTRRKAGDDDRSASAPSTTWRGYIAIFSAPDGAEKIGYLFPVTRYPFAVRDLARETGNGKRDRKLNVVAACPFSANHALIALTTVRPSAESRRGSEMITAGARVARNRGVERPQRDTETGRETGCDRRPGLAVGLRRCEVEDAGDIGPGMAEPHDQVGCDLIGVFGPQSLRRLGVGGPGEMPGLPPREK